MKNFNNIQPSINPKMLPVQRGFVKGGTITGQVFIRNVSIDPRDLIKNK